MLIAGRIQVVYIYIYIYIYTVKMNMLFQKLIHTLHGLITTESRIYVNYSHI